MAGASKSAARGKTASAVLGARGEQLAAAYLEGRAMVVLDRNWRCRDGELDLVALDGDEVVFVEVKTRSGTGFGLPAEAVTKDKENRIRRLAGLWLATHRASWTGVRFDVIGIVLPGVGQATIEHYTGAF